MTSKTPVRSAEDIDETALSYAEIKALATGNPLIIEKCQLEMEVSRLKILKAGHLSQRYALEDNILKKYPLEIAWLTGRITGYLTDEKTVAQHPIRYDNTETSFIFPSMTVGGILYTDKKEAGVAILEACKAMASIDPVPLGEYRGFSMILSFDIREKEYSVTLAGSLRYTVRLGTDIRGNITRLDNALDGLEEARLRCEAKLTNVQSQLEVSKREIDNPFPQEQEFKEKSERLKELDILLNIGEKDYAILDYEPDEGDVEPQQSPGRER